MPRGFLPATLLSTVLIFAGSLLAPVEVRFVESITHSTAVSGYVFGFASLVLIFSSYYIAKLSRNWGRRRVLLIGAIFGIVYALLYASVTNLLGVFGVKFGWALAVAATNPVLAAYTQQTLASSAKKGRYFGYYFSAQSIAGSGGALLGGYVFAESGFHVLAFVLAVAYASALSITLFLPEQRPSREGVRSDRSLISLLKLLIQKPALRLYVASNLSTSFNYGVKPFLWPLIIFALSGSDVITGSVFASTGVIAFVLLPFAGMIADRVGAYRVLIFELLLFSVTGLVMALTDSLLVFWVAVGFYTIAEVLNVSQFMVLSDALDDAYRAEAMALDASFDQILAFAAPLFAGILASLYSPSFALLVFAGLYVLSFIVTFSIARRHSLFHG